METKEQKPWYHGVKWTEEFYGDDVLPTAIHFGHNDRVCFMPTPGSGEQADAQRIKRHADLIAAAPETATQRDSLLSVQKQLVEALEETIDHLRMFYQARWSEYEGTEQYLIGNARAAILAAKASS